MLTNARMASTFKWPLSLVLVVLTIDFLSSLESSLTPPLQPLRHTAPDSLHAEIQKVAIEYLLTYIREIYGTRRVKNSEANEAPTVAKGCSCHGDRTHYQIPPVLFALSCSLAEIRLPMRQSLEHGIPRDTF
jgi:hypothetical protein